jgi:hypothetical protein
MELRKIVRFTETIYRETFGEARQIVTRAAAAAIVTNPYAGQYVEDLGLLFDIGRDLGEQLSSEVTGQLSGPAVSYGKAAIVGALGEFEHGGALIHPKLGKPMRAAIGGGKAVIPSNVKVGAPGTSIDIPLGHKDESWSFDHFDTMTISVADSPRPKELMMIIALADGGRIDPRCGSGPQ